MRHRIMLGFTLLLALTAVLALPWFALQEARRQAYNITGEIAMGLARDVLHRANETSRQSLVAFQRMQKVATAPCSSAAVAVMQQLDLTSTYIQAVGYAHDGQVLCSSMASVPIRLGAPAFYTARGYAIYADVTLLEAGHTPLLALGGGDFFVVIHRDLPLDTWTTVPGVSLAVFHLDRPVGQGPLLAHGDVSPSWAAHVASQTAGSTFTDAKHLVAVLRSQEFRLSAVAAVPIGYMHARERDIALRLVPGGILAGIAVAATILLLARQQRSLAAALKYALRRDEFYLQYQPIIDLASGHCVGAEALLRWRRPNGESIGPDLFIPVAEQTGIITRLTERVLELIQADTGAFLARAPHFHIALNVAAKDFQSGRIVPMLDRFLERSGAAPSNLTVEITERTVVDLEKARGVLLQLRARGIAVSLDDFGTGYSSLSYLEALDVDHLKIDRSFIEAIGTRAPTSQVVQHIIAMARTLKLCMVAEGVESQAQADFLETHGVQYAQGWLFGKPMAFNELTETYRMWEPPKVRSGERSHRE
ncbi:EAL domain-containing protein [Massilia arenosa]|uniref:cyclic-guanylate-specific phosphodiesterase n=1 Tax=Zemynaea arenosa TaxID=2561931 RepID=A0A4Y9SGH6_9BURK|nr:EAL domain-containing protein [Massilia arenosa]TFW19321.1 EAL domain-containing protein [Massilia arenosa]